GADSRETGTKDRETKTPALWFLRTPDPQRDRRALVQQLRLQLEPAVQGAVLERSVAERVLELLERVGASLDSGHRRLEQRHLGLVALLRSEHLVDRAEQVAGEEILRLRLLLELRVAGLELFPRQDDELRQLVGDGQDALRQPDGPFVRADLLDD